MQQSTTDRIFTYPFIALWLVAFFGFGNIAIFFNFYTYLGELGISPFWRSWLLAFEPLTAFILRPIISPWLNNSNGVNVIRASLVLNGIALLLYPLATTVPTLIIVRIIHGGAFVTLVSATITLLVGLIPPEKSGTMFSIFTLNTLATFAIVPPAADWALSKVDNMGSVYAWAALLVVPALLLMIPGNTIAGHGGSSRPPQTRPSFKKICENLMEPGIALLIFSNLLLYMTTTVLYFFMNDFGKSIGLANPGYFFTVSMCGTIAVRIIGNTLFDKFNQRWMLVGSLTLLACSCAAYAAVTSSSYFLIVAAFYGAALGFAIPLLQALMLRLSPPAIRGLNANLMLTAMDAAYFMGPFLGGTLLTAGVPFTGLFLTAAGLSTTAGLCIVRLRPVQS